MITAFDIGGSTIKAASARDPDNVSVLSKRSTPLHDFQKFVAVIKELIVENPTGSEGIAISLTGVIDIDTGLAKCANIPCIDQRPMADDLERELKQPVWIANDADCFALAETHFGAARGHANVFGIILGTGAGGALVLDGKLVSGAGGFAGEWGHGPALPNDCRYWPEPIPHFACGCGQKGCVDTIGGARGLERMHRHLHNVDLPSTEIINKWLCKELTATQTVNCVVDLISGPLAMVLNVTGSSIAPVGGGLSGTHQFVKQLDHAVRQKVLRNSKNPIIVPHKCKIEPGLMGAAMLGLQKVHHKSIKGL